MRKKKIWTLKMYQNFIKARRLYIPLSGFLESKQEELADQKELLKKLNNLKNIKAVMIIDHTNLVLITDPNDELIDLAYKSYMSKIITGLSIKSLNSKMLTFVWSELSI